VSREITKVAPNAKGRIKNQDSLNHSKVSLEGRRATGGEGEGPAERSHALREVQWRSEALPTSRLRSLGGADEEALGRAEEHWRAGVLAPPLSPDKGGYHSRAPALVKRCM